MGLLPELYAVFFTTGQLSHMNAPPCLTVFTFSSPGTLWTCAEGASALPGPQGNVD